MGALSDAFNNAARGSQKDPPDFNPFGNRERGLKARPRPEGIEVMKPLRLKGREKKGGK